ncbi:hypothetical protein TNCT_362431 [Trichonephila clavata]|uniref:Uncharacterized protein n=1 Tax=Trichonephila clavata TaxID=2740835 RepID=A0A8X6KT10_TRICU|nr:hypothetical protein TNCT_362431 [Trichonephila clavata]
MRPNHQPLNKYSAEKGTYHSVAVSQDSSADLFIHSKPTHRFLVAKASPVNNASIANVIAKYQSMVWSRNSSISQEFFSSCRANGKQYGAPMLDFVFELKNTRLVVGILKRSQFN